MIFGESLKKPFEILKKEKTLEDLIPMSSLIAPGVVCCRNGWLISTVKVNGMAFETADDRDLDRAAAHMNNFYRTLARSDLAVKVHRVRRFIHDKLSSPETDGFAKELLSDYNKQIADTSLMATELYVTLILRKAKRIKKDARKAKDIENELRDRIIEFEKIMSSLMASLSDYSVFRLSEYRDAKSGAQFSNQLSFYNFLLTGLWAPVRVPNAPINKVLGNAQIFVGSDQIEIQTIYGSSYFNCLELKDYPQATFSGILDGLLYPSAIDGRIYPFVETMSFCLMTKNEGQKQLQLQRKQLLAGEDEGFSQIQQIGEAIDGVINGEFVVGEYSYSLLVFGSTSEEARKNAQDAAKKLQDAGFLPYFATLALGYDYLHQLPGAPQRSRVAKLTSVNFVDLASLHNFPEGKRNGNPWGEAVALLRTPSGQPYYFNFHSSDPDKNVFGQKLLGNTILMGASGTGKTALLNFLLCAAQKYRTKEEKLSIIFFDKDKGAEIAIRALGGGYLPIQNGKPTGINPFQLEPTEANIQFLIRWTKKLVTRSGAPLSATEEDRLSHAIRAVMGMDKEYRRLALIPQNIVQGSSQQEIENSIPKRLRRWINDGDLAWCFDNETNTLDLNEYSNFGIDGTDFLANDEVGSLFTDVILHLIETQVLDGRRAIIVMDEFWRYLKDPDTAAYAFDKLKTIRKQNGIIVFATQSPADILTMPNGSNFVENCTTQVYLPNPRATAEQYIDGFKLTVNEFSMIKNFHEHSRMMVIKQDRSSVVARLDLSAFPEALKVLSGSTDNIERCEALIAKFGSKPEQWMPHFFWR